jgi:hypothetical protein
MNMADNEVATKKDLAEVETRLRADLAKIETRMDENLAKIETRITENSTELETRIVDRMTELIRDIETSMLTAFHGYGKGQSSRMHLLESADSSFAQRLAALEDRVLNLETRRGPGQH